MTAGSLQLRYPGDMVRLACTKCGRVEQKLIEKCDEISAAGFAGGNRKATARTNGVAVTVRFAVPAAAMLLLSGFTQAELEKAKSTTDFFRDAYWKCLADEILKAVPTNMSAQEFSVLTKSACPKERSNFFNSLSNYIVMLQPHVDRSTVAPAANIAVLEAQKDAVQALNDLRSGKRQMPPQPR